MKYLFLFTIGPVQSFIAQARKTQDLFAGSIILSDLIDFAMDELKVKSTSCEFIFPEPTIKSKPNRFVAIIETDNIQKLGDDLKCDVEKEFYEGTSFGQLVNNIYDCKDQLKDFLKVYWVAKQFDESGDYKNQYKTIEQLLGAVKNVRCFNWFAEKGRKCSINGEYNVKFYQVFESDIKTAERRLKKEKPTILEVENHLKKEKLFNGDNIIFISEKLCELLTITDEEKKIIKKIDIGKLQAGEGLCAVSFLKRVYDKGEFDSTANIALMDTLNKLDDLADGNTLLKEFSFCFGKQEWRDIKNGQLFYDENLTEEYFKKQNISNGGLACAKDKLKKLNDLAKDYGLQLDKSKYYAILAFDADGMGSKLGSAVSKTEHIKLSKALGVFATKAEKYINNSNYGRTVYAGGDDFLGFINLNHLFKTIQALRQIFDDEVNAKLPEHLKLTFSSGVAIAHYKTPLSEVLTWARKMEKEAKNIDGILDYEKEEFKKKHPDFKPKNAFGIAVLKGSGEIHKSLWKWQYNGQWTTEVALDLINNLLNDKLSRKFINTLTWTFDNLMDIKGVVGSTVPTKIIQMEIARLIKRQTKQGNVAALGTKLFSLYEQSTNQSNGTMENFLSFLHICEFVGRYLNKTQPISQPEIAESL